MRLLPATLVLAALAGCSDTRAAKGPGRRQPGLTLETQPPNARDQHPAFAGQTRAPYLTANVAYEPQVITDHLEHPWSVAFLPDRYMLVTERPGRMRIISPQGELSRPVRGLPEVDAREQGGLLDVALDPQFAQNNVIYWSYAEPREHGNGTTVARATLVRDNPPHVEGVEVIFREEPTLDSTMHFGSRLVFDKAGMLLISLGERSILEGRYQAQRLDSDLGKIVRIRPDGRIPDDNPFVGRPGARPEIWSLGHRNVQAMAIQPATGELWEVEHGARGGDEINVIEPGKNYGWPTISYGLEYSGKPIGEGRTQAPGLEQPIYYWDPVIAPSGMLFYTGTLFPAWRGSLFVGSLAGKHIARLTLDGHRVVGEERLLVGRARVRDVRQGPDGAIYVLTDEDNGELLKLVPSEHGDQTARR